MKKVNDPFALTLKPGKSQPPGFWNAHDSAGAKSLLEATDVGDWTSGTAHLSRGRDPLTPALSWKASGREESRGGGDRGREDSGAPHSSLPHTAQRPRELRSSFLGAFLQGGREQDFWGRPRLSTAGWTRSTTSARGASAGSGQRLQPGPPVTKTCWHRKSAHALCWEYQKRRKA